MLTLCFLPLILVLSAQAIEVTETFSSSLITSLQCVTHMVSSPVATPIPTSTITKHLPPDIMVYLKESTPISTITTPGITVTSTVPTLTTVTTTLAATTNTYSSTSTVTAVVTTTTTSTFLSTITASTSTSTTSTSLVPAPSGFEAAYDSAGEVTLQDSPAKRRRQPNHAPHGGAILQRSPKDVSYSNINKFPSSVLCTNWIQPYWVEEVIIILGKTSTAAVPGTPVTTTVTSTLTSTSTVVPAVSTTVTTTTTTTSTSTSTSTSSGVTTSTSTMVYTSTTTSYAACATNNLLGPQIANGSYTNYGNLLVNNGYEYSYVFNSASAYDCCVSCVTEQFSDYCQVSVFQPSGTSGVCEITGQDPGQDNPALCNNPGLAVLSVEYTSQPSEFSPIIFSNGPCGVVVSQ